MECSTDLAIEAAQTTIVCVASSFSWASIITPIVVLGSLFVAALGVVSARANARQRARIDMIEKFESTEHYRASRSTFYKHAKEQSFAQLNTPKDDDQKKDRRAVQDYLNHYELVSIGVQKGILDPQIYREYMLGPFIRDWNDISQYVQRERWKWDATSETWSYRERVYKSYQDVACSWSPNAVRLTKDSGGPPDHPEGPGDEPLPEPSEAD